MPNSQAVLQHLPFLRRYARALTGSQASGDAYVAATLESLIASPEMLAESANSRVGLYRLFTKIWGSLAVNGKPEAGAGEPLAEWEQELLASATATATADAPTEAGTADPVATETTTTEG